MERTHESCQEKMEQHQVKLRRYVQEKSDEISLEDQVSALAALGSPTLFMHPRIWSPL